MGLSKHFYEVVAKAMQDADRLEIGASLRQTDRVIAQSFGISESTARNWRRGSNVQISRSVARSIIDMCAQIAPTTVPDLQLIEQLSRGVADVKHVTDTLVDEIALQIFSDQANWAIYSGPLKLAHDPRIDPVYRTKLMNRAVVVAERLLELALDRDEIPSSSELFRYSVHGWYAIGATQTREDTLSHPYLGVAQDSISLIEKALYIGDGCVNVISQNSSRISAHGRRALAMLECATPNDEQLASINRHDALIMLRSVEATRQCYLMQPHQMDSLDYYRVELSQTHAENLWVEGIRHESLGYLHLLTADYSQAAYYFAQAANHGDQWLSQFGPMIACNSLQSMGAFAAMMAGGPNDSIKLQMLEGLVRATDPGFVVTQMEARLCAVLYYGMIDDQTRAIVHLEKLEELVKDPALNERYQRFKGVLLRDPRARHVYDTTVEHISVMRRSA